MFEGEQGKKKEERCSGLGSGQGPGPGAAPINETAVDGYDGFVLQLVGL